MQYSVQSTVEAGVRSNGSGRSDTDSGEHRWSRATCMVYSVHRLLQYAVLNVHRTVQFLIYSLQFTVSSVELTVYSVQNMAV